MWTPREEDIEQDAKLVPVKYFSVHESGFHILYTQTSTLQARETLLTLNYYIRLLNTTGFCMEETSTERKVYINMYVHMYIHNTVHT